MTPRVLTIFNCGTAFDRESLGETTAALFEDATGLDLASWDETAETARRYSQFKLINDGPGSIARLRSNKTRLRSSKTLFGRVRSAIEYPFGLGFGVGMKEMMEDSVELIQELHAVAPLDRINLCGWSRGGIMCLYLANVLWRDPALKEIPIGIVANDPVAGTANNGWTDYYQIPPNVDVFCAFVMLNENWKILEAIKPHKMSKRVNKQVIIMPGIHGDGVLDRTHLYGRTLIDLEFRALPSAARIAQWNRMFPVYDGLVAVHVMVDFLTGWALSAMGWLVPQGGPRPLDSSTRNALGTAFNQTRTQEIDALYGSRKDQLKLYSDMVVDTKKLYERGPNPRYKLNGIQQFGLIRSYLVIGAGYYINELHEFLFKSEYPVIHDKLLASDTAVERLDKLMTALGMPAPAAPASGMVGTLVGTVSKYLPWPSSTPGPGRITLEQLKPALASVGAGDTEGEFRRMFSGSMPAYDSLTRFRYWAGDAKVSAGAAFDGQKPKYADKLRAYPWGSFHKTEDTAKDFVPWR